MHRVGIAESPQVTEKMTISELDGTEGERNLDPFI
jgi:hypothetical protein